MKNPGKVDIPFWKTCITQNAAMIQLPGRKAPARDTPQEVSGPAVYSFTNSNFPLESFPPTERTRALREHPLLA